MKILGINGSASRNSSNLLILKFIQETGKDHFDLIIYEDLSRLPHFRTELTDQNVPEPVTEFRTLIEKSEGVIISTPEYIFSIPSGLKNALEWCVSATVFTGKPVAIITASAGGEKGHEELKLILKTVMAEINDNTSLLIRGVKGKIGRDGKIVDPETDARLKDFVKSVIRRFGISGRKT